MDELRSYLFSEESWLAYLIIPVVALLTYFLISWTLLILLRISNKHDLPKLEQLFLLCHRGNIGYLNRTSKPRSTFQLKVDKSLGGFLNGIA